MHLLRKRVLLRILFSFSTVLGVCRTSEAACLYLNPDHNVVQQWNKIAEEAIVAVPPNGAGAIQNEGLLYMGYVSAAVYDAVVAIEGGYQPYAYRPRSAGQRNAVMGASVNAAVSEAAYRVLRFYFPSQAVSLVACHDEALASILNGSAKTNGIAVGAAAADGIIRQRASDGRQAIGTVSTCAATIRSAA